MLIDARTLPEDTLVEHDICIVGAGAAGITLAQEFDGQPYQVCLLESGGLDFDDATQSLYTGENVGVPYFPLKESRVRYLGGSTNLWGGTSRPLDEIDFEDRPWMPYSGWPFTKAELDPYYERAQKVCGLGPYKYDFADWEDELRRLGRLNLPFQGDEIVTYIFQVMQRTNLRFGEVYRAEIERSQNIKTYLHANVVEIETNDTAQAVTRLRIASLEGNKFWVRAKIFILACGGIENPRLLLVSNKVQNTGLGNQYDLVGRFFMEHPYLRSGKVILSKPNALYPNQPKQKIQVHQSRLMTALALSKEVQEREQILNFALRLVPIVPEWLEAYQRIRNRNWQKKGSDGHFSSFVNDLSKVIANFDEVIARAWAKRKVKQPPFPERFFESHLISEQAPNPDSRVTLSRELDKLGLNRVKLDWRLCPIDKYTIQRSQQIIGEELKRAGFGQLEIDLGYDDVSWQALMQRTQQRLDEKFAPSDSDKHEIRLKLGIRLHEDSYWQTLRGSYHHMGTTRMSTNPRQGVVNEHSQVHGISNLYVTGSSVFPTGGLSNPTLTIVALAIRLADDIKARMRCSAEAEQNAYFATSKTSVAVK
jgi:choline dehydrogenase-like flavoprotein